MRKSTVAVSAFLIAGAVAYGWAPRPVSAQAPAPAPAATPGPMPAVGVGSVVRLDPGLDALVAPTATVDKVAGGIRFAESPLWRKTGVLWFSDLVGNIVYQMTPDGNLTQVLNPGGYDGHSLPDGSYLGPNGMTPGPNGTLTLCQHGNRRIVSVSPDKKITVLTDNFEGKKLNSPNDVVYAPDGSLYFTDPPFGLVKRDADPDKELKFNGVFRLYKGKLQLLVQDDPTPNGIAFSPDYKTLYVTRASQTEKKWMRYDVQPDGSLKNERLFADASASKDGGTTDGMKVDVKGNVYGVGPGGIWVMSPDGQHLGTIKTPEGPAGINFGGDDYKTLYIAARTSIYKIKLNVAGLKPVYY